MKRLLLSLSSVLALVGSLGLVMYGSAIIGVFEVLTVRIVDPPEPAPAALMELQWAVISFIALVAGLVISCVATGMSSGQTLSTIGRLLYVGAGLVLVVGAMLLIWAIIGAKASFVTMASAPAAPTVANLRDMIQSAEPKMTVGFTIFVVSASMLLAAGLVGFRATSSQAVEARSALAVAVAIPSALVGVIVLLLLMFLWLNGSALGMMITDTPSVAHAAELAAHLLGILNKSLFLFGGIATLGILQALAAILLPTAQPDLGSES